MSSEWLQTILGEFVRLQRGHDLTASEQEPGDVPIMGSAGQNGTHSKALAAGPGVVVGRSGASAGRVHFSEADYWPHNTCLYVTDFLGNSPRFVYYLLQTIDLASYNSGSAQASLNRNFLYSIRLDIPNRSTQDMIVEFLESLDHRITLLRATNATLEGIAQTLFKSWFVDFDPVRAKMEGRAPAGMDEATAALFPDGLEESKTGAVPRGWYVSTLAEQTSKHGGSIQTGPFGSQLHASDYSEHGTPVAMPKDLANRRINTSSVARVADEHVARLARHQLAKGDIVFSRRGDVERHALVMAPEVGWLCGTGCLLVRPGKNWQWPAYLSMLLDTSQVKLWLVQHAVGATMPNLNTGILGSIPLVAPPANILDEFENVAMALEMRRSENLATMETLACLRDTLLPRLISGQLRIPEAAPEIEAIAA